MQLDTGIAESGTGSAGRRSGLRIMLQPCWYFSKKSQSPKMTTDVSFPSFRGLQRQIFMGYFNEHAHVRQTNAHRADEKPAIMCFCGAMTHPDNIFIHVCVSF